MVIATLGVCCCFPRSLLLSFFLNRLQFGYLQEQVPALHTSSSQPLLGPSLVQQEGEARDPPTPGMVVVGGRNKSKTRSIASTSEPGRRGSERSSLPIARGGLVL